MSNPANITVYALAAKKVTCSITSGADGRPTACVPVGGEIELKAVPSSGSGTYEWSTTSKKITLITLNGTATQTATVKARNQVSASHDTEKVQLVFTPTGGAPLAPLIRDITVISVTFSESTTQNYGYDDMDKEPNKNHHVSVRSQGLTTVQVDVDGGGTADDLEFATDDPFIARAAARPDAGARISFPLTIEGGADPSGTHTSIKAKCKGGPVCATIEVHVYQEKTVTATVAKVWDQTVEATRLAMPAFDVAAAATTINTAYQSVVATLKLTDATPTAPKNIPCVVAGDGALVLEAVIDGKIGGDGIRAIKDNFTATDRRVVIVKKFLYVLYLSKPYAKGDRTITLKAYDNLETIPLGRDYFVYSHGLGSTAETVNFTSRADNVFTLDTSKTTLTKNLSKTDGIILPLGGFSADLTIIPESTTQQQRWIIGHELGHALLILRDVVSITSLMNWEDNFTGHRLRFKPLPLRNEPGKTESQWEVIPRD